MQKAITLFFLAGILSCTMYAQQSAQYSMYMMNPFAHNPAYAGMEQTLSFNGAFRSQWIGIAGSPSSQQFNVHLPFGLIRGGLGLNVENEVIGARQAIKASLAYNYYVLWQDNRRIAIGGAVGLMQQTLRGTDLRAPEGNYEQGNPFSHNDDFLPQFNVNASSPTTSLGAYYQGEYLHIGIAADNILENRLAFNLQDAQSQIQLKRHYFLYSKYQIDFGEKVRLEPSILLKSDINEIQTDVSIVAWINPNFFIGTSYRGFSNTTIDALVFMAGTKLNGGLGISYAYDYTLSKLQSVSSGSHEIMLTYNIGTNIGMGKLPPIIYNPRNL